MSDGTKIEWTDATWTPIRARRTDIVTGAVRVGWHCEHASEGCRNCYAEGMNRRLGTGLDYKPGHLNPKTGEARLSIFLDEKMLLAPLRWKKPRKIFVCSMTDLFADLVTDEMIDRVFAVMALAPQHVFQVLTKRSARMRDYCISRFTTESGSDTLCEAIEDIDNFEHDCGGEWDAPLPNVWLGVSVEDRTRMMERAEDLRNTPAAIRWWSAEPLLGDLGHIPMHLMPHWIVAGGESGPRARIMQLEWARSLRDRCSATGTPFLFKQMGEWCAATQIGFHGFERFERLDIGPQSYMRVGKKRAGRLLDGVQHDGYPS